MIVLFPGISSNLDVIHMINAGCTTRPDNASVTAKQAKSMFALLCSLGLRFTAMITNTLSRNVKGQVMVLTVMLKIRLTRTGIVSDVSSPVVELETLLGNI